MRSSLVLLLTSAHIIFASPTVFSVYDDLLAFPQYKVIFSDSLISDTEAFSIISQASSIPSTAPASADSTSLFLHHDPESSSAQAIDFDPSRETYELLYLHGEPQLCAISLVATSLRNETSEREARAAERQELARATDRGWELLKDMEGNCLYFVSGWWSYRFCHNQEITQFHQLPPQPEKLEPPKRDPSTKQFVLGKVVDQDSEDKWGNSLRTNRNGNGVDVHPETASNSHSELQVKGDTRYLVQRMEGGTTCDLTGKPRRIEVQFHCNPAVTDRIGYIKEVTICSYLMVVYTSRLCNDAAFLPPKETKAHPITCRPVVPENELASQSQLETLGASLSSTSRTAEAESIPNVGGILVGGRKWMKTEGKRMPTPANFAKAAGANKRVMDTVVDIIASAKSKAEGGQVEIASDAELRKMGIDPEVVKSLRETVTEMAREKGWKIEVVDTPGEDRKVLGIVDVDVGENEDDGEGKGEGESEVEVEIESEGESEGEGEGEGEVEIEMGAGAKVGNEERLYRDEL